jgi:hypothetical protein
MKTSNVILFKKIISHLYQQFTDIEFVLCDGCEIKATTPNLMLTARIVFHEKEELAQNGGEACSFECDSYHLYSVTKHITRDTRSVSISLDCQNVSIQTNMKIILEGIKKHDTLHIPCTRTDHTLHIEQQKAGMATPMHKLTVSIRQFRDVLLRLQDIFENILLAATHDALWINGMENSIEVESKMPMAPVPLLSTERLALGKYPYVVVLKISEFATLSCDDQLCMFVYPENNFLYISMRLQHQTDVRFVCAPCGNC